MMKKVHEPCASRGYCWHAENGKIQGRRNVESGQIIELASQFPLTREANIRGGTKGGKKVLESGQLASIRSSGGRVSGRNAVESGRLDLIRKLPQTKIAQQKVGRIMGLKNVESGYMRKLGLLQGRKNVESGRLFNMVKKDTKPELAVKAKLDELVALGAISGYVHPFNLNNRFFVDFYVPDTNTIIEVDGCYWHKCKECGHGDGRPRDRARNAYIKACGYNFEIIKEHEL